MNVHVLITEGDVKNVEVFSSRKAMTTRRTELKRYAECSMLPPIKVSRDAAGILFIATLVNDLHTRDYAEVIGELENGCQDS